MNDAPVSRVFIVHDPEECTSRFIEHVKWQVSIGIRARIFLKYNNASLASIKRIQRLIGTIDFAIIDGSYLIAFLLEEEQPRDIMFMEFHRDARIIHDIKEDYNHLWAASISIEDLERECYTART